MHRNVLKFIVADNGIGIRPEIIPKLGEPYETYDQDGKYNKNGIGLGLNICKSIIGQLGPDNKLYIESNLGEGTNFSFFLYINCLLNQNKDKFITADQIMSLKNIEIENQILRKNQEVIIEMNPIYAKGLLKIKSDETIDPSFLKSSLLKRECLLNKVPSNKKSKKINQKIKNTQTINVLVADDDAFSQLIMKTVFSKFKFDAFPLKINSEQVFNGEEAIKSFVKRNAPQVKEEENLDIIFLDGFMPIKTGYIVSEEITHLIEKENFARCKIIGCTALKDLEKFDSCGMNEVLIKPVENEKIFEIFNSCLFE